MASVESIRTRILKKLVGLCQAERAGAYYVRRGPINWAEFAWSRHAQAIAIITPEFTIMQPIRQEMTVQMEVAQSMPDEKVIETNPDTGGFNDNEIEGMVFDVEQILRQFMQSKDSLLPTDDLLLNLDILNVEVQEMSSADFSVQGIVVTFTIQY